MSTAPAAALFLDRDGVINDLVWNPATSEMESPHALKDLRLVQGAIESLYPLQDEFRIFLVSNQPSCAKGKTSLENIEAIAGGVTQAFAIAGIRLDGSFYCYHHPEGSHPTLSRRCECRKPEPFFLLQAAKDFGLDLARSWMVGDQDTDVECGRRAGCRTIAVLNPDSEKKRPHSERADFRAESLREAVQLILNQQRKCS